MPKPTAALYLLLLLAVAPAAVLAYTWTNVRWGGGGFISGLTFHPTVRGLAYARTDIGGAYRRDPGSSVWTPLNDDIGRDDFQLMGVLSLAVDPNDAAKLYLATGMYLQSWGRTGALLRSSDRGATWSRVELPFKLGGNADGRGTGERLQVDPHAGLVLFLGTNQDGLWRSTDSGQTWSRVWSFPATSTTFVLFDGRGGSPGQLTKNLYVGVASPGGPTLLRSTDAGQTWWAPPNQPGGGLMALSAAVDASGNLYVTYGDHIGPNGLTRGAVYSYRPGAGEWTNITPPDQGQGGFGGVAVSARRPGYVVISTLDRWWPGDNLYRTKNRGRTWRPLKPISTQDAGKYPWVLDGFKGMGSWITDVEMDPFLDDHVLYNTGYGLWETDSAMKTAVTWRYSIDGIEETAVSALASPPTGAHLLQVQGDVNGARYDTDFADVRGFFGPPISSYSIDYAQNSANFVARTTGDKNGAYLSWDNGVKWFPVETSPVRAGGDVGKISVSATGSSLVWVPGGQSAFYSNNNGKTWTASGGYPVTGSDGYFAPVGDRSADGVFYTYDYVRGLLLESGDGGRSFGVMYSGVDRLPSYAASSQLLSVPTQRRDLWLATPMGLYHINGVAAPAPVRIAGIQAAYAIGFGARAPSQPYPTLFLSGKKDGVTGLFRSVDQGATWVRIDDDRHRFNLVDSICGDQRVFGQVFVAGGGRGVLRGTP